MKYIGKRTKSTIPQNAVETQHLYTETRGSMRIEWYDVWVPDPDEVKPVFREDEIPNRSKVRELTEFFTSKRI